MTDVLSAQEQHQWDQLVGPSRPPSWCPWRARPAWSRRWWLITLALTAAGWALGLVGGASDDLVLGAAGMILLVVTAVLILPLMYQDRPPPEPTRDVDRHC